MLLTVLQTWATAGQSRAPWSEWELAGLLAAMQDPAESTQLNTLRMIALDARPYQDQALLARVGVALESQDEDVVLAAIEALEPAASAANGLTKAVALHRQSASAELRAAAIRTLSTISADPGQDLAGLGQALTDPDEAVVNAALTALNAHPELAAALLPELFALPASSKRDQEAQARQQRLDALSEVLATVARNQADRVLPELLSALTVSTADAPGQADARQVAVLTVLHSADRWLGQESLQQALRAVLSPVIQRLRDRLGGVSGGRQVQAARQRQQDERVAVMAAVALLALQPEDVDTRAFLNREIKGDHYGSILAAQAKLPRQFDLRLARALLTEYVVLNDARFAGARAQDLRDLIQGNPGLLTDLTVLLDHQQQSARIEALTILTQLDLPLSGVSEALKRRWQQPVKSADDQLEHTLAALGLAKAGALSPDGAVDLVQGLRAPAAIRTQQAMLAALAQTGLPSAWTRDDTNRLLAEPALADDLFQVLVSSSDATRGDLVEWLEWAGLQKEYLAWRPESRAMDLDLADELSRLGPRQSVDELRPFLTGCIRWTERCDGLRSFAYRLFGHDRQGRLLIAQLSDHEDHELRSDPWLNAQSVRDRVSAIAAVLKPVADPDRAQRRLFAEAARKLLALVHRERWTADDEAMLISVQQALDSVGESAHAEQIDRVLQSVRVGSLLTWLAWGLLAHFCLWLVLIALYPHVAVLRRALFWNALARRLLGLGYVGLLLQWVPGLSRRLFAPYQANLVPAGALSGFQAQSYYGQCRIRPARARDQTAVPIDSVLHLIRGRIVLQGASGLGKTTLLRHLAAAQRQTMILLRALDCKDGVLRAIQLRLSEPAHDPAFLAQLVHQGALILMIDGLNEASPDTRARIDHFLQSDYRGHFLLTTQPLNWEPPALAEVYELLPLEVDAIQAFLLQQWSALKAVQPVETQFEQAVVSFLEPLRQAAAQGDDLAGSRLQALCNPMEAVLAAELLAKGQRPDTGRLQQQFFALMQADYQQIENRAFPEAPFAERVYEWRLSGQSFMDISGFEREADLLCQHKLMRRREEELLQRDGQRRLEAVWQFRHDRIMDYALLPAFLGEHQDRQFKHWRDARFNGVYDLLAERLPLEQARELLTFLQDRAAESNDSALCLRFAALLREREGTWFGSIEQDYLATLERIRQLGSVGATPGPEALRELQDRLQMQLERTAGSNFPRRREIQQTLDAVISGRVWLPFQQPVAAPATTLPETELFDVFLSHNSKDKPAVRALAHALKGDGLKVWYDEWELIPGRPIQEALEEAMLNCRTAAVLVGADGFGPWEVPEMRGFLALAVERQLPVIPVLLPGAPAKPSLPLFLKQFLWVDLRDGVTGDHYDRLCWGITGKRPATVSR